MPAGCGLGHTQRDDGAGDRVLAGSTYHSQPAGERHAEAHVVLRGAPWLDHGNALAPVAAGRHVLVGRPASGPGGRGAREHPLAGDGYRPAEMIVSVTDRVSQPGPQVPVAERSGVDVRGSGIAGRRRGRADHRGPPETATAEEKWSWLKPAGFGSAACW